MEVAAATVEAAVAEAVALLEDSWYLCSCLDDRITHQVIRIETLQRLIACMSSFSSLGLLMRRTSANCHIPACFDDPFPFVTEGSSVRCVCTGQSAARTCSLSSFRPMSPSHHLSDAESAALSDDGPIHSTILDEHY
jgi:hypothetical protein